MSSTCLIVKMKHVMLFKVHAFDCSKHNTVHIPYSTWIYKQRSIFRLPLSESIKNLYFTGLVVKCHNCGSSKTIFITMFCTQKHLFTYIRLRYELVVSDVNSKR